MRFHGTKVLNDYLVIVWQQERRLLAALFVGFVVGFRQEESNLIAEHEPNLSSIRFRRTSCR